jgi:glycosyltransferase involved in cell wall biosynthesis
MLPVIVIPAYQPDELLLQLINTLLDRNPTQEIIVVNDGSLAVTAANIFKQLSLIPNITLLQHQTNLGKGQALKTAFRYFLQHYPHHIGLVTADADGQHLTNDIIHLQEALLDDDKKLWLGVRHFERGNIPLRSFFGNELTRKVYAWFSGYALQDTQTGLRGIPTWLVKKLIEIDSGGYQFEMHMLIFVAKEKIAIGEITITTVYINQNRASHFNPLWDSVKIYFIFLRYSFASLISAGLDLLLFFISFHLMHDILLSTLAARIISSVINFMLNKKMIFKSSGNFYKEIVHYTLLALFSILLSYALVSWLYHGITLNIYASKILADTFIFLFNFFVQKAFIFKKTSTE